MVRSRNRSALLFSVLLLSGIGSVTANPSPVAPIDATFGPETTETPPPVNTEFQIIRGQAKIREVPNPVQTEVLTTVKLKITGDNGIFLMEATVRTETKETFKVVLTIKDGVATGTWTSTKPVKEIYIDAKGAAYDGNRNLLKIERSFGPYAAEDRPTLDIDINVSK